MNEEDFQRAKVLGYAPPQMIRDFVCQIERLEPDETSRIRRVARDVFSLFPGGAPIVEALYDINMDYSIAYIHAVLTNKPHDAQRVVDDFAQMVVYRKDHDIASVRRTFGILTNSNEGIGQRVFTSNVVLKWTKDNSIRLRECIINDIGIISSEELKAVKEKWRYVLSAS